MQKCANVMRLYFSRYHVWNRCIFVHVLFASCVFASQTVYLRLLPQFSLCSVAVSSSVRAWRCSLACEPIDEQWTTTKHRIVTASSISINQSINQSTIPSPTISSAYVYTFHIITVFTRTVCYAPILIGRIVCLARMSVRPSVRHVRAANSKTKNT